MTEDQLRRRIRLWLVLFVIGLIFSGVTAFPLDWEARVLVEVLRGIPFFWQCIDMSFGIVGIVPLWLVYRGIRRLEAMRGSAVA